METNLGKNIPPWAQGAVIVIITAGVGLLSYRIWKGIKNKQSQQGSLQEDRENNQQLNVLNSNNATKQTISADQAAQMANQLFSAMDGYGTDFKAIFSVFSQMKNDADFLAVSNAYGIREISSGKLNPEPNFTGTMSGALATELGSSISGLGWLVPYYGLYQIAIKDDEPTIINKVLAKNNIKYRI